MTREYKKRKPGDLHAITFTPRSSQMKNLAKSSKKKNMSMSALLREIIDEYYDPKKEEIQ